MLMKLPTRVQIKRSMIVSEVKPTSENAMLAAPKKIRATAAPNKTTRTAKNSRL